MAVPPFDPAAVEGEYLYAAMADHVQARIKAGELRPGARLSGEQDLAEEYHVSLATSRRAVAELRERGAVYTLRSKGTFVSRT